MSMRAARSKAEAVTNFQDLGDLVRTMSVALQPPERLLPSEAAEKYRTLQIPGAYHGPYLNETTPYMVEPLDVLADREKRGCIFVGPAQCGKALPLVTPLAAPDGWTTMGEVQPGDWIFGSDGRPTQVLGTSEVMHDHECLQVEFDDGTLQVADADHLWTVRDALTGRQETVTTSRLHLDHSIPNTRPLQLTARRRTLLQRLLDGEITPEETLEWAHGLGFKVMRGLGLDLSPRRVVAVRPVPSVPVRCIKVDAPDSLFLAGRSMVPTHNTDSLVLNAILYKIICDPIDTIVYQTSQTVAADFSRTRVDRMHRHSPETGKRLLPASSADTVHAKYYDSGIVLNLSWPTINEMSGRPRGLVILTDYDRMPQDVDGEGSPFDLGMKRTTTFRSAGKTICESSPGFEVTAGSTWIPRSKHEAPPCDGIMALYNRGDRRRWYWKCPECGEWFEPAFDLLKYPTDCSASVSGTKAWMACPHNACVIEASKKFDLNKGGRWLRDGQRLTSSDVLEGEGVVSSIASFWMMGVAAAFAPWASLVEKYLQAEQEYERTGSQEALKATVNTDQGVPYRRRGQNTERRPEELKNRASQWPRGTAPAETRFLVATVDIQGRKWVCQVHGVTPGRPYELVLVDRFDITKSERRDADGERCPVEPASYAEDWELLKPNLLEREYAIAGTDKMMAIKHVFCDSGGKAGVTARAYAFWQSLRQEGDGLQRRFQLVKGDPLPGAPRAKVNYMDAAVKGSSASVRGEVPVLMLNSNILKDQLDGMLNAPDQIRWAEWLPDEFFSELCVEFRELNGWKNPKRHRNEAWDLLYYCVGGCVWLGVENINWEAPPSWALPATEGNTLCRTKEEEPKFKPKSKGFTDMAAFGNMLA